MLDLLRAIWVILTFVGLFFWLPSRLFHDRAYSEWALQVGGRFARTVVAITLFVPLLAGLKVFNTVTVFLLLGTLIAGFWMRKHARQRRGWAKELQQSVITLIRRAEGRPSDNGRALLNLGPRGARWNPWYGTVAGEGALVGCLMLILATTCALHFQAAYQGLRLDDPEEYGCLLRGRELLLNMHAWQRPMIVPAVIATTSLFSSTDPMQVTRFLSPLLEVFAVVSTWLLLRTCTGSSLGALAAMYCFGTAALPTLAGDAPVPVTLLEKLSSALRIAPETIPANKEFEIGLIFLLMGIAFLADWQRNSRSWSCLLDFACSSVLVALVSQCLFFILVVAAGGVLLWSALGPLLTSLTSYVLVAFATLYGGPHIQEETRLLLPLAASLAVGCLLALLELTLSQLIGRRGQTVLLVVTVVGAVLWFHPQPLKAQFVEYEAAARETQVIASDFPRQKWIVVAPTEQLAETLGLGGHEDLCEFVERYESVAGSRDFRFPEARVNLFVYVEKRPFRVFDHEPKNVPSSVLSDITYRNYRSPAGRASVESAALRLCEEYRRSHDDADIFFDDDNLRIYHFRPWSIPAAGKEE